MNETVTGFYYREKVDHNKQYHVSSAFQQLFLPDYKVSCTLKVETGGIVGWLKKSNFFELVNNQFTNESVKVEVAKSLAQRIQKVAKQPEEKQDFKEKAAIIDKLIQLNIFE